MPLSLEIASIKALLRASFSFFPFPIPIATFCMMLLSCGKVLEILFSPLKSEEKRIKIKRSFFIYQVTDLFDPVLSIVLSSSQ